MNIDINIVLAVIGTIFLLGSNLVWVITFYSERTKKKYAAEREFQHIKRNQEQLVINLSNFFQDVERKLDEIKVDVQEIKFECRIDKK